MNRGVVSARSSGVMAEAGNSQPLPNLLGPQRGGCKGKGIPELELGIVSFQRPWVGRKGHLHHSHIKSCMLTFSAGIKGFQRITTDSCTDWVVFNMTRS